VDLEDRVGRVVLAREHRLELDPLDRAREYPDRAVELGLDHLALACELEKRLRILEQRAEPLGGFDPREELRSLLLDALGLVGIAPELGVRQPLVEIGERTVPALDIKETSAATRLCRRGRLRVPPGSRCRVWARKSPPINDLRLLGAGAERAKNHTTPGEAGLPPERSSGQWTEVTQAPR
jgi:hypothetical protein